MPILLKKSVTIPTRFLDIKDIISNKKNGKYVSSAPQEELIAGKNTYVYDAHTYHTKVPPEGIEKLITYFTEKGDTVLDPFCGSGMTGVAALRQERKAILSDLSPAAVFISKNFCTPIDVDIYLSEVNRILEKAETLSFELYGTSCRQCAKEVPISYCVWSYEVQCPKCKHIFPIWETARHKAPTIRDSKILSDFPCPKCNEIIIGRNTRRLNRVPVEIGYRCCEKGRTEQKARPNSEDLRKSQFSPSYIPADLWYPKDALPIGDNTQQAINHGIDSVDKLYTGRNLYAMAFLWNEAKNIKDSDLRDKILYTITSLYQRVTLLSEFRFWGGSSNSANYNVPKISNEQNVFHVFERKAKTIALYLNDTGIQNGEINISIKSATSLTDIPDESIDYIFTDPPFGGYINYSEMNYIWESWLGRKTDIENEAIINKSQGKTVVEYESLMLSAFREMYRVLKVDSWVSIVFHNSSKKVWGAMKDALISSGLPIDSIQIFDKKQGTIKMFTSSNTTGYDLILHCKKGKTRVDTEKRRLDVTEFISESLKSGKYISEFIHVDRDDEVDARKIYSEWISRCIIDNIDIIDFSDFNKYISLIKRSDNDDTASF